MDICISPPKNKGISHLFDSFILEEVQEWLVIEENDELALLKE
jgi:hypothetical protein